MRIADAFSVAFGPSDVAVLARPCRGCWIEDLVRYATQAGAGAVYISKPANVSADFTDESAAAAAVLARDAGASGEIALAFTRPLPDLPLRPGERYVKLPLWRFAEPMLDGGDRWISRSGTWFPKGAEETAFTVPPAARA